MVRQADDCFDCFGAKPDKGFWTRDLGWPEVRKGTLVREWNKGTEKRQLTTDRAVDTGQQRDQSEWVSPGPVKENRSRWVGIPSSVVEFSLESMLALVYICTQEMQCRLNWPKHIVRLFVCSFSPGPLIVFLVAVRKCAIPLSEPQVDHRL